MAVQGKKVFVSYTRDDRERLEPVLDGLRRLRCDVWLDQAISGGQEWWNTILEQIRMTELVLVAVSPAQLESVACRRELGYALALGKPVLPVILVQVPQQIVPPELTVIQMVDFTKAPLAAAFDLTAALMQTVAAPPLPDPLPEPPAAPISYLSEISARIEAPALTIGEQWQVVGSLKAGMAHTNDREAVLELVRRFRARDDLFVAPAEDLNEMLRRAGAATAANDPAGPTVPTLRAAAGTRSQDGRWIWNGTSWIPAAPTGQVAQPARPVPQWTAAAWITVLGLIFCGPLGMVSVWFTRWSTAAKLVVFGITALLWLIYLAWLANNASTTNFPTG